MRGDVASQRKLCFISHKEPDIENIGNTAREETVMTAKRTNMQTAETIQIGGILSPLPREMIQTVMDLQPKLVEGELSVKQVPEGYTAHDMIRNLDEGNNIPAKQEKTKSLSLKTDKLVHRWRTLHTVSLSSKGH